MKKGLWGTLAVFCCGAGFDLTLNIFGGRAVVAAFHPFIGVLAPWIGAAALGGVAIFLTKSLTDWGSLAKRQTIHELESAIVNGTTYYEYLSDARGRLPLDAMNRWAVIAEKYKRWIVPKKGDEFETFVVDDSWLLKAGRSVEILRAYGYLRSRWKIQRRFGRFVYLPWKS